MPNPVYQTLEPATPPKGLEVQTRTSTDGGEVQAVYLDGAQPLPTGAATADNQTNGLQLSRIVDLHGHQANVQQISASMDGDEYGVITNAVIHGKSTAGGGAWVDVKVSPSGAVQVGGEVKTTTDSETAVNNFPASYPVTDNGGSLTVDGSITAVRGDNWLEDAFQRDRVSTADKRFDFDFHAGKNALIWDEVGNGAVTFSTDSRDVVISITGTATTDSQSLIQHAVNIYTPLSSQILAETGVLNGANLAGTARGFLRSSVTGTATEEYVTISSTDIDFADSQIFLMDFQSLRVGRVRFALDRSGEVYELGEITNDNERATGYWQTANLPIHYRVYNTTDNTIAEICYGDSENAIGYQFVSALSASQTVRAICAGVRSEGGGDLLNIDGFPFFAPPVTQPIVASKTVSTTLIPLVSIRVSALLNGLTNRTIVVPKSYSLQTSNPIEYVILYRPSLTGASWVDVDATYSGVQYDITASAVSGGVAIDGDTLSSGNNQTARAGNALGKTIMALGYTGTADILTIAAIRTGAADAAVRTKIKWEEIR